MAGHFDMQGEIPPLPNIYFAIFDGINKSWLSLRNKSRDLSASIQTQKLSPSSDFTSKSKLMKTKMELQSVVGKLKDLRSRALMLRVNIITLLDTVSENKDGEKLREMVADLDIITKSQIYEE